ncbi:MAG: RagB/SusD family nutrient uptake outer membrane protein [Tannerella sp.]|jgi:hypothetical protein|nr:RagB/SusD family nutrient uptake outer membrane protein [Tannerella sp.]
MKKIIYIYLIITGLLGTATSCSDLLDAPTKSSMDESVIFSTPVLAEKAIAGVLQSFAETNSYRGRYLPNYGFNTDCEVYNDLKSYTVEKTRLCNYNANASNTEMNTANNAWAKFYEGIERANLAIRGLRLYGDVENNAELAQILGEVITLRAVLYCDLLKAWGDVPERFNPINSETIYLPRSDRDVIYKQLLADLEEASELVAWPTQSTVTLSTQRVNKAFVKGLRARIALAAGGYGQRPDGQVRLSSDPDLSHEKMFALVKEECLDVINSGTCHLASTFEELFKNDFCGETLRAGREILWEIPFSEGRGRVIYNLGVRHTNTDKYTQQAQGGVNGPNPIMWYEYDPADGRREVTCVPYQWTNGIQEPRSLGSWCFGKYRYEWLPRVVVSSNDDGLNWLYMRYADVILMAAEVINDIDGPAAAAPYLKMIRDRAFPDYPEKVNTFMQKATASKTAFFNAIVDERALEFTGEMLRKGDLIRWNLLKEKLTEASGKLQRLENREGEYADLPANIYYKNDGEQVIIYGLEHGQTDAAGSLLKYPYNKSWTMSSSSDAISYWDALFVRDPNTQQYWPIWQVFTEASNGTLDNIGYNPGN